MTTPKQIRLGYLYEPHGSHPSGWRYAGGRHDPFNAAQIVELARLAEAGKFDFFAIGDRLTADATNAADPTLAVRTEPFTTASFLATKTNRIGLLVTANASYYEPYNLARLTASLDHVTHGRAVWNIATGASAPAARNYSQSEADAAAHYGRAGEAVDVIRELWDSWEDGAFIRDKTTGAFVDGNKIHPINHQGQLFSVKGPLNVARPPQGQLVLAHEAGTPLANELAAREADIVLARPADSAAGKALRDELRKAAVAQGRGPDALSVLVEITPVVAETDAAANLLLAELNALGGTISGAVIVGGPERIADQLAAWVSAGAADGFVVRSAALPDQLRQFVERVIPELQRRGLARTEYRATTLRENLELPAVPNRLVA